MTMNDTKNASLAFLSSVWAAVVAMETQMLITVLSAIVLPILFFAIGKTADIWLQIYLAKRKKDEQPDEEDEE